MNAQQSLILRAAELARHAPSQWNDFLGALRDYTTDQTTILVKSAPEELPRQQGRAQVAVHLTETLANCLTLADKIKP